MSVIDEKGRLFGKVNLIDALVVILLVLVLAVAGKLLFSALNPAPEEGAAQTSYADIVTTASVPIDTTVDLEVGQKVRSGASSYDWGEVKSVDITDDEPVVSDAEANGELEPTTKTVTVVLHVAGTFEDGGFYKDDGYIQPGKVLTLETPTYFWSGYILDVKQAD